MTEEKIQRINELYHKAKGEGLTEEEKKEQQTLRKQFIEDFKLKSLYRSDVILTAEDDILTLTTCHKYDVSNGRLVVHAVKVGTGMLAS